MSDELKPCMECGMLCGVAEYHPYAACLMFKACHNSETVKANLEFVRRQPSTTPEYKYATFEDFCEESGLLPDDCMFEIIFNAARELKE